ncbi:MAG: hypothetical protein ABJA02_02320 [Acidobacteriota bacterium]
MKRYFFPAILMLAVLGTAAHAQKSVRLKAAPPAFKSFYAKFRGAVAKSDKQAIASMTAFPFQYGFDAGDEGTWSRAQFIKHFARIFSGEKAVFAQADPTFDVDGGTFGLTNMSQASHFTFSKKGSVYKLTAYIVEP